MSQAVAISPTSTNDPLSPPNLPASGRLGSHFKNRIQALMGPAARENLPAQLCSSPVSATASRPWAKLSDSELVLKANQLRGRAKTGEKTTDFITEAFALCSIAIWRTLGMRAFDVQIAAGLIMFRGSLVELATGEGKTLTAAFPAFLHALAGRGVHVTTVNDYLAVACGTDRPRGFRRLGLKVGAIQMKMDEPPRLEAYRCDITYGTASEFGFRFPCYRLKSRGGQVAHIPFWAHWTDSKGPP